MDPGHHVPRKGPPSDAKVTPKVVGTHIIYAEDGMPTGFKFTFNYGGVITNMSFGAFQDAREVVSRAQWLNLCVPPGGANVSLVFNNWDGTSEIEVRPDTTTFLFSAYGGPDGCTDLTVPTADCFEAFQALASKATINSRFRLIYK